MAQFQGRDGWNWGSWSQKYNRGDAAGNPDKPHYLGIQRVMYKGLPFIEGMVDWGEGAGWERVGNLRLATMLNHEVLLGVASCSHDWDSVSQSFLHGPTYCRDPEMIGAPPEYPTIDDPVPDCPMVTPGFYIRTIKSGELMGTQIGLNFDLMNELLDTGQIVQGMFVVPGVEEGSRIEPLVNLHDSGGRGEFHSGNGYDDQTYPGIDNYQSPTADPHADGDDDNHFATEILTCIELTKGLHIFGVNSDDGAIIKFNGVEVYRTEEGKGTSNRDFIVDALTAGKYILEVRTLEMGGGAAIELHEVLYVNNAFTRVLMGDVANGASPVYVPEPATICLLGLGGLSLLRMRRRR
jgi:hypothetical protein